MKVIVTGFNAFGGHAVNPSLEALKEVPDFIESYGVPEKIKVAKLSLPTCCSDAWTALRSEIEGLSGERFAVLLSGLAETRQKIALERFALNVRHFRIADNNGHLWDDEHIQEGAADALRTQVPLKELLNRLSAAGLCAEISNHAGTFVCNETYYRSLLNFQKNPLCRAVLFVHFPPCESYPLDDSAIARGQTTQKIYAEALCEIAAYLASL